MNDLSADSAKPPPKGKRIWGVALVLVLLIGLLLASGLPSIFNSSDSKIVVQTNDPSLVVMLYRINESRQETGKFRYVGGMNLDAKTAEFSLLPGSYWLFATRGVQIVERRLITTVRGGDPMVVRIDTTQDESLEAAKLEGDWHVVSMEENGKAVRWFAPWASFTEGRFGAGFRKDELYYRSFLIDPRKSPKQILLFDVGFGHFHGIGIYKLEEDVLTLLVAGPLDGIEPPRNFSTEGSRRVLSVLRRINTAPESNIESP